MDLTKQTYVVERPITVDGKSSTLRVELSYSIGKAGPRIKISPQITTKQLSYNEDEQEAVIQQVANMTAEAVDKAMHLIEEWMGEQRPEANGQLNLIDAIAEAKQAQAAQGEAAAQDEEPDDDGEPATVGVKAS